MVTVGGKYHKWLQFLGLFRTGNLETSLYPSFQMILFILSSKPPSISLFLCTESTFPFVSRVLLSPCWNTSCLCQIILISVPYQLCRLLIAFSHLSWHFLESFLQNWIFCILEFVIFYFYIRGISLSHTGILVILL